ncbi:MAG TPA: ATP-binding cassette domain-containing protein [Anaerolineales bacterium]|nr:ATP-binding cassette domain-containing protein [Anaerolineales bacterium]
MNVIHVESLTRKFGDFVAVQEVTFDVYENEVFGFLGPNGAGKTTTINMLCTLLRPSGGRAEVNGIDVAVDPHAVRQSIGLIFQDPSLDEQLTGRENLRFHAMLYDVSTDDFRRRSEELLDMVELTDKADDLVRTYSGGMKRRLEISRGLLHRPKVLFLDEPTLGLDPQTRRHIWEYLFRLRDRRGITMFMTTHYMDEAENCDRIAIIDHGQIVALDTPEALKGLVGGDIVTVRTSNNEAAITKLTQLETIETRRGPEGQVIIETAKGDQFIPRMINIFADGGDPLEVHSVNLRRPTLEDVFIKLTGRAIREEEASGKDQMRLRRRMFHR